MYIKPFISITWWASLENREVTAQNLDDIIADILDKSAIRNTVHGRKMDLLRVKRRGASHSDFLMKLEEIFRLVEYEKITGPVFLTQLFLEQADGVMQKIATDILSSKPEGDTIASPLLMTPHSVWANRIFVTLATGQQGAGRIL